MLDVDDAPQINRRRDQDYVHGCGVDCRFQFSNLLRAIAHRRKRRTGLWILFKRFFDQPMAYGRGSIISLAPNFFAAIKPAPNSISPCVGVGPSSTMSTRLPRTVFPLSSIASSIVGLATFQVFAALAWTRYCRRCTKPKCAGRQVERIQSARSCEPPHRLSHASNAQKNR